MDESFEDMLVEAEDEIAELHEKIDDLKSQLRSVHGLIETVECDHCGCLQGRNIRCEHKGCRGKIRRIE